MAHDSGKGNGTYKQSVSKGGKKFNICQSYPRDTSGMHTPMAKEAKGEGGLSHSLATTEKGPGVSGGKGSMDY